MQTTFTVKQAAEALGVSSRTLRRRLEAGDLSYTRTQRGQRQVVEIHGAELARFAQVNGLTLRRQLEEEAEGQTVAGAPRETEGTSGKRGQTEGNWGQTVATEGAEVGALGAERIAALEAQLRAAERERDFLRRIVEDLAEALKVKTLPPAPPAEQPTAGGQRPRSWWSRLWGGGD